MPQRHHLRRRPVHQPDETSPEPDSASTSSVRLTARQVASWAELIAEGRGDFPVDLTSPEQDRLLAEVRSRLQGRLVHHIARAIAAWVQSDAGPRSETDSHAGT
jgi:hypothetical protein